MTSGRPAIVRATESSARGDGPVVREEQIGDGAEPPDRVLVLERDRLVGEVPARHDERPGRGVEEEGWSGA